MAVYDDEKIQGESGAANNGGVSPRFNVTGLPRGRRVVPKQPGGDGAVDRSDLRQGEEKPLYNPDGDKSGGSGSDSKADSSSKLKNAEETGGDSANDNNDDDSIYNPDGDRSFRKRIANIRVRRQVAIGASIVAIFGGGAFGTFVTVQGPAQVVQLSEILKKPLSITEHTTSMRFSDFLKHSRVRETGNYGETRVGEVGSKFTRKALDDLKKAGVQFNTNNLGSITSRVIDTSRMAERYPEFHGATKAEAQRSAAEIWGGKPEDYKTIGMGAEGTGFKLYNNTRGMGIGDMRAMINQHLAEALDGKKLTALNARFLAQYFGLPSIFSPYERAKAKAVQKVGNVIDAKIAEKKRLADKKPKIPAKAQAAIEDLKGKLNGKEAKISNALLISAGLCLIRSVADDVPAVNRATIVEPAVAQEIDKTAAGDAIKSNNVGSVSEPGATVGSFTDDKGQTIWSAKALKALTDPTTDEGIDIEPQYAQAFSIDTTASNMKKTLGGNTPGAIICSPIGQFLQITASIALIVTGPFDGGVTTMGQVAAKAGAAGAEAAATGAAISMLQKQLVNILANKATVPEVFSGPLGGNLLAFASKEFANIVARSRGGVALAHGVAADMQRKADLASKEEFHKKSLKDQLFDVNDYRSLTAQVGQSISPSLGRNLTGIASTLTNVGSLFSHLSSVFMPKASAANEYDWGFPIYGIPDSMLENESFKDPYANADEAAKLLDGGNGNHYVDKAKSCFGVEISKGDSGWQAVAKEDVNPNDSDYIDAHCGDVDNQDWARIMLFVLDSRTIDSLDCYMGETDTADQSCTNIGMGAANNSDDDTPNESDVNLADGSAQDLAKQLLPYIDQGKIVCGSEAGGSGPANCLDIQNTAKGKPIGGNCKVESLTPHLLSLILGLVKDDGWSLGISATCSNHHAEGDGAYAGHSYGSAADFSVQNGAKGAAAASNKKFVDDAASLLSQTGGSFGQLQCHPRYPSISGGKFTVFNDGCNHQHIRAAP